MLLCSDAFFVILRGPISPLWAACYPAPHAPLAQQILSRGPAPDRPGRKIKSPAEAGQRTILEGIKMKMCGSDTQIAAVLRQLMCFSLISHPAHARAVGSSRQRCGVCWCRVYRVIPKRAIRTARTTQMLTRMAEILPSRRVSQSEPCDKIIRR